MQTSLQSFARWVRYRMSKRVLLLTFPQRFTSLSQPSDVESLGYICKILSRCEPLIDVVSVHVSLRELLASALAYVEDYDCDTVGRQTHLHTSTISHTIKGDPQTAVIHLGEVVLFLQEIIYRHNVRVTGELNYPSSWCS